MKRLISIILLFWVALPVGVLAQDSLTFRGQLSGYFNYSSGSRLPLTLAGRFIPEANYARVLGDDLLLDFEVSANLMGSLMMDPPGITENSGTLKPYRSWARLSGNQFEVRAGLQKINFGSATMLRPLMWFDLLDPRDPLQLTDGVYGLLGRYYALNNANFWLWILYGNEGIRAWQATPAMRRVPEAGGRIQLPAGMGEVAASYHFRPTEPLPLGDIPLPGSARVHEHRVGLDGKWDIGPGVWFETSWLKNNDPGLLLNHLHLLTLGADYTLGMGNGLTLLAEHLEMAVGPQLFSFDSRVAFTALSASYPLSLNHHLTAIVYRDWTHRNQYHFLNWRIQMRSVQLFCMAFWNPREVGLPQQAPGAQLFSGKGGQLMLVYNY